MKKTFNNVVRSGLRLICYTLLFATYSFTNTALASVSALNYGNNPLVNLSAKSITLKEAIRKIQSQTKYEFSYDTRLESKLVNSVDVQLVNENLPNALDKLFEGTGISYKIADKIIMLSDRASSTKDREVKIIITDKKGDPIPGATITVKGKGGKGASTNASGQALLNLNSGDIVACSFIGMATREVLVGETATIKVELSEAIQKIDEVVVVGFGSQKKAHLTAAVSTISSDKLEGRVVTNVSQALQGAVPGLVISTSGNGGEPGAGYGLNIRGGTSINGGNPLVLVDNMEMSLNDVNPADIESVTVLKDAAAASIYGSRASFGVILVTTKKGKEGKPTISYHVNYGKTMGTKLPKMLNGLQFANYFNTAAINSGQPAVFSDEVIERIKTYMADPQHTPGTVVSPDGVNWAAYTAANASTDWFKEHYLNSAPRWEHQVNIQGGTKSTNYYMSGSYLTEAGLLRHASDNQKRYTFNANFSAQLYDWLRIGYKGLYTKQLIDLPPIDRNLFYHNIARRWPTNPVKDPNGYYTNESQVNALKSGYEKQEWNHFINTISAVITPLKGWDINMDFNQKYSTDADEFFFKVPQYNRVNGDLYDDTQFGSKSNFSRSMGETVKISPNIYSSYTFTFADSHNFKVMAGMQHENQKYKNISGSRENQLSLTNPGIGLGIGEDYVSEGRSEWATLGYFGRLNYNYLYKYFLEVNCRYDGSSAYRSDKRWAFFPSYSVGWDMAKENFWTPVSSYVSMFKLRASYGSLGNRSETNGNFYSNIPFTNEYSGWNFGSAADSRIPATYVPGLKSTTTWETVTSFDIGTDVAAFNNRLQATFDWYERKTTDMVGPAEMLPDFLGASAPAKNNSDLRTRGWEFSLSWSDKIANGIKYWVNFNIFDYKTVITKYPNPTGLLSQYYDGREFGEIWGYESAGLFQSTNEVKDWLSKNDQSLFGSVWNPGDVKYVDINGDGKVDWGQNTLENHGDLKIIGNSTPRYQYSFTLGISWEGLSVSTMWQGVGKRDYWASGPYFWGVDGGMWQSAGFTDHLDYWSESNPNGYFPKPYFAGDGKNKQKSTRYLQDASYLRLKNLTINYDIPVRYLNKMKFLNGFSVYFTGENLYTYTKLFGVFDPENVGKGWSDGKMYPLRGAWTVGAKLIF